MEEPVQRLRKSILDCQYFFEFDKQYGDQVCLLSEVPILLLSFTYGVLERCPIKWSIITQMRFTTCIIVILVQSEAYCFFNVQALTRSLRVDKMPFASLIQNRRHSALCELLCVMPSKICHFFFS